MIKEHNITTKKKILMSNCFNHKPIRNLSSFNFLLWRLLTDCINIYSIVILAA